jgi:glycosyltransferase involved in cell wall biosynthesis
MTTFSIIIPVFNAESCLKNTVDKVIASMNNFNKDYEIILIDDGSRDNSWNVIKELKTQYASLKGIRLNKNYGQHNVLLCGLNHAEGEYIITIDDDLEQNPEDISTLFSILKEKNIDVVYGVPKYVKRNFLRKVLTNSYKFISRVENKNADKGSTFRIFTKRIKDNLINHSGSLFFIDEIILWYTNRIEYIKVDFLPSQKKASGYTYSSLFDLSLRLSSLSSTMPLRMVRTLGFSIFIASFILAFYFIIRKFFFQVPMGYTSIIVAILFSTGIITFTLGIIGEYLGNLIALSNKKPAYFIHEKI